MPTSKQQKWKPNPVGISIVVSLHNEGRLAHPSLKSIQRAIIHAQEQKKDIKVEVILVADSASSATTSYLKNFAKGALGFEPTILHTSLNDTSLARNAGVNKARYRYVTVINGDDLMSREWIHLGLRVLNESLGNVVVHPEYTFTFDGKSELRKTIVSSDKDFDPELAIETDPFPSLMMTTQEVARMVPYRAMGPQNLPSHSSWLWNMDTLSEGIPHSPIKGSLLAKRHGGKWLKPVDSYYPVLQSSKYLINLSSNISNKSTADDKLSETKRNKHLRRGRDTIESLYNSRITKRIIYKRPRLKDYASSLRNETLHLLRPMEQEVKPEIPSWIIDEVQALNNIDLQIFFASFIQEGMIHHKQSSSNFVKSYWDITSNIPTQTDYLFLVPFIKNGGAEREISNNINAILKFKPSAKITVLATENSDSPWAHNLNRKVNFVEPNTSFFTLSIEQQALLIANLSIQLKPRAIHIVNSFPGYIALQNYAEAMSETSKIYITIFMIDRTDEGREAHALPERMLSSIDYVKKIFTDNETVVKRLVDMIAVKEDKFSVHYQPLDPNQKITDNLVKSRFRGSKTNVIWAGRVDRQKRPDLLIQIAREVKNKKLNIDFDVYGSPIFEDSQYLESIKSSKLVKYNGGYESGLKSLTLEKYDIFLMTSEWEGMPNVLIEAILGSMLVIAPNVGGVNELIQNGITGYLVDDFSNIDSYIGAIQKALDKPDLSRKMIVSAQKLVNRRHSQSAYEKRILAEKEYLN